MISILGSVLNLKSLHFTLTNYKLCVAEAMPIFILVDDPGIGDRLGNDICDCCIQLTWSLSDELMSSCDNHGENNIVGCTTDVFCHIHASYSIDPYEASRRWSDVRSLGGANLLQKKT